jgi:hypothetical protein
VLIGRTPYRNLRKVTKKHKHNKSFGSTIQLLATWGKVGDESESGGLGLKFGTFAVHFRPELVNSWLGQSGTTIRD